jgi:hypothetical protein
MEGVRDLFGAPGHPAPGEERMAATFLAVPRRHPHHDDPEMRTITATQTLTRGHADASVPTLVPIEVLAGGKPTTPVILALDLGQRTGWAVRSRDGAIASGVHEFRPGRFEGGGMIWLRFRAWLQEIDETSSGVGVVVFEEVRRHAGAAASHIYGGYLAHLTAWAEANKDPIPGRAGRHHQAAHRRQGQRRQAGRD